MDVSVALGEEGWSRPYQKKLALFFLEGGKQACAIWHRKAGKDRVATFIEAALAIKTPGLYWHALPKYEDARKVIWDAIMPNGRRLIDWAFPKEMVAKTLDHEMKKVLVNGSIWQPVGADNYDSLVGAFPRHITWSEYALMHPHARQFLRPALALGKGSELIVTTPRGYNHAHDVYQISKDSKEWYSSLLTVDDTKIIPKDVLAEERRSMPDELFRQEYYCDFSAANVGSILGRYVEQAEKAGRISDEHGLDPDGAEIEISSDIGFRDTAAWWFWQPRYDGFGLVDYDEGNGLDAQQWIERLRAKKYKLGKIWLPHDAVNKSFAYRRSPVEQFQKAFGWGKIGVVPRVKQTQDRINAARLLMPMCYISKTKCAIGTSALRSWAYAYDEEKRVYSKEPLHDWASNGGDSFSYGAQIMQQRRRPEKKRKAAGPAYMTYDWLIKQSEGKLSGYNIDR
jgi:phage terminase large subunit